MNSTQCALYVVPLFERLHERYRNNVVYIFILTEALFQVLNDRCTIRAVRKNVPCNVGHEYMWQNLIIICNMLIQQPTDLNGKIRKLLCE